MWPIGAFTKAIAIGVLISSTSSAAVVFEPANTFGAGLLTRDTDSHLDWLDLSETVGMSRNEALAMTAPGGRYEGFRLATSEEWSGLALKFESQFTSTGAAFQFTNFLGCTQCASNTRRSDGLLFPMTFTIAGAVAQEGYGNTWTGSLYTSAFPYDSDTALLWAGVYLVAEIGRTPNNPWLPDPVPPPGSPPGFIIPIDDTGFGTVVTRTFVDPIYATGYDYFLDDGDPLITSVIIPNSLPNGDSIFEIWINDTSYDLYAGLAFDVSAIVPGGVNCFRIRGIDISEMIDPSDPLGFVTGLTFSGPGPATLRMVPFEANTAAYVPEPDTWAMFITGFGLVGAAVRRRRLAITRAWTRPAA